MQEGSKASQLNPYLNFNGDARQAVEFYQGVFGGNLTPRLAWRAQAITASA